MQGLARQVIAFDGENPYGQVHLFDHQHDLAGELNGETGLELHRRAHLAIHRKAPAQREELQPLAAEADHGVRLADAGVIKLQGGGPQPADDVAWPQLRGGAVRQPELDRGAHRGVYSTVDAPLAAMGPRLGPRSPNRCEDLAHAGAGR